MDKKLKSCGGIGWEHSTEDGIFEVRATGIELQTFKSLTAAKSYYEWLQVEKAVWDLTDSVDLIDCQVFD